MTVDVKIVPRVTGDLRRFDILQDGEFTAQNLSLAEAALAREVIIKTFKALDYLKVTQEDYPVGGCMMKFNKLETLDVPL